MKSYQDLNLLLRNFSLNITKKYDDLFEFGLLYYHGAAVPECTVLFWLFSDFRCGVPIFIVILIIYEYKNR